jgi:glutamyl-tRNA reductase
MSNESTKVRMVIVGSPELEYLLSRQDDLGVPRLYKPAAKGVEQFYVADADELRAWRASQHTSGGDK